MIGSGYVGLVSATCLAAIGHEVTCVDLDEEKIRLLSDGVSPIYEPGIEKLIRQNQNHNRISFTTDLQEALKTADVAFIAVGTPEGEDGSADLKYVEQVAHSIGKMANKDLLVIVKSTVPVGSCERVEAIINKELQRRSVNLDIPVASNPEFLKEGNAISDFMKPDRIIVGLDKNRGRDKIDDLYHPFTNDDPSKLIVMERRASELVKYGSNCMLATRVSFMNELARLCEPLGVNIDQVRIGMGTDPRIGKKFLYAGPGFGGSCFPKDVNAMIKISQQNGVELNVLQASIGANEKQKDYAFQKIKRYFNDLKGKHIAIWGLSFKPGTDDVRETPSKHIINKLLESGATITAHDPQAIETFAKEFGPHQNLNYRTDHYEALEKADAVVLVTDWTDYKWPNWNKVASVMNQKIVFDLRNQYQGDKVIEHGFHYDCIGRPTFN